VSPSAGQRYARFGSFWSSPYEDALRVLQLSDRQDPITELVAKKIIEAAQTGERDPRRIRERALRELGIPPAHNPPAGEA
jgi:hypothetical protein